MDNVYRSDRIQIKQLTSRCCVEVGVHIQSSHLIRCLLFYTISFIIFSFFLSSILSCVKVSFWKLAFFFHFVSLVSMKFWRAVPKLIVVLSLDLTLRLDFK